MLPASTKGGGQAAAFPDTCKTPSPGGPVPVPYPNTVQLAQATGESTKVKFTGAGALTSGSEIPRSMGDEPGTLGGVISNVNMSKAVFARGSSVVKVEGQKTQYLTAPTKHNGANANAPAGVQVSPSQAKVLIASGEGSAQYRLPGVTRAELALAASDKTTRDAQRARAKVLKQFLRKNGQEYDPATKTFKRPNAKQLSSQCKGHDLTKPVKVGPPPPCPSLQTQWQRPNGFQGSYYTNPGTQPNQVGIASYARDVNGRFVSKVAKNFQVSPKARYLESIAAPVKDHWSVPGMEVPAAGGSIQRVIGDRAMAIAF